MIASARDMPRCMSVILPYIIVKVAPVAKYMRLTFCKYSLSCECPPQGSLHDWLSDVNVEENDVLLLKLLEHEQRGRR